MISMNSDDMSLQWGPSQVVYMNTLHEDTDSASVSFEPTPVFNQFTLKHKWIVSVVAAGMHQSEFDVQVDHLQDVGNILTIIGESQSRPIGENQFYTYKRFHKHVKIPRDVIPDSKSSNFADGLLLICFHREVPETTLSAVA
jgi:HSP20 family molecular chaperone IbpA